MTGTPTAPAPSPADRLAAMPPPAMAWLACWLAVGSEAHQQALADALDAFDALPTEP
jgi:hypothetical protein